MILLVDMSMMIHSFFHVRKVDDVYDVTERCLHKLESLRAWFLDQWECEFIAVFDSPSRELFRKVIWPEYKEGRTKHEDLPEIEDATREAVLNDQDWKTIIARPTFEADDEMASLANHYSGQVVVYSSDRDCHAFLESGRVVILKKANVNMINGSLEMTWYSESDLIKEYGFMSHRWSEYQTLVGSKDNVPGWEGVGPKKAAEIVRSRHNLLTIDVNDPPVSLNKKQVRTYEAFRELYPKIKSVRTIRNDLPHDQFIERLEKTKQQLGVS